MTNPDDPADMPTWADTLSVKNDCWCKRLTKREYFAAMAMQGFCNHPANYSSGPCNGAIVERAVLIANSLIAELNKVADKS